MRTRNEIIRDIRAISNSDYLNVATTLKNQELQIEVLLDIRDLLTNNK